LRPLSRESVRAARAALDQQTDALALVEPVERIEDDAAILIIAAAAYQHDHRLMTPMAPPSSGPTNSIPAAS
jgi:hypothetical protein